MSHYIVGIDLGTTHTVVAYAPVAAGQGEPSDICLLDIAQLVAPGEVAALPLIQIALLDGLQLPAPLPLADYSAILFVSPNAVAGCVMQTKRKWVMATAEEWVRGAH